MALALLAASALIATGGTAAQPLTYADSGKTVRVARGSTLTLRLGAQRVWNQPRLSTRAVELTPVLFFRYPGFQEWTISARAVGKTTITAVGRKAAKPARHFRLTVVVR
jgi:predicted secreted protein